MSGIDVETKRKLREMGAAPLLEAIEAQDETLTLGMGFEDRLRLVVDEAHSTFNHAKVEAWALARDKPQGQTKFLKKYAAYTLLVIDEWLLDHPDEGMRSMLLELLERRYDTGSTVFCTQYAKKDWHQRLGSGVHADAIMDRIVHNTIWVDTGTHNMREHASMIQ